MHLAKIIKNKRLFSDELKGLYDGAGNDEDGHYSYAIAIYGALWLREATAICPAHDDDDHDA